MEEIFLLNRQNMMEQMGRGGKGELFILKYLSDKNTAVIPSEIGGAMHASSARISAALGSLEKKNQIHREIDVKNRRNILVTITEEGRKRSRSEMCFMREKLVRAFTEMGERDAIELVRLTRNFFIICGRIFEDEPPD